MKYCCERLKYCESIDFYEGKWELTEIDGLECKEGGDMFLGPPTFSTQIFYCPFCGAKLNERTKKK